MAKRAPVKQKKRLGTGDVVTWRLHPLEELIDKYLAEAADLKKKAVEKDDRAFVIGAERILKTLQQARSTLRLCPQNQFRHIELKAGAKMRVVKFAAKKHPVTRFR